MLLFTATWCNPCNQLKTWLKQNNIELDEGDIIDVDEQPELASEVRGLPTLIDGDVIIATNEKIRPYLVEKYGKSTTTNKED